jgi:hypothetical protein
LNYLKTSAEGNKLRDHILKRQTDILKREAKDEDVKNQSDWTELVRWLRNIRTHAASKFLSGDEYSNQLCEKYFGDIVRKACPELLLGLFEIFEYENRRIKI